MTRRSLAGAFAGVAGVLLLPVWWTHSSAAAARLEVTASPVQVWNILDGLPEVPANPEPPVPEMDLGACGDLGAYDEVVYGTRGPDVLVAARGRQVLVGLDGDDVLRGGNHDDCLVGGDGRDQLFGGNGRDVLVGGAGADRLDGGSGKDRLEAGGDDGDVCVSVGAPDELIGCGEGELTLTDGAEAEDGAGPAEGRSNNCSCRS